MYKNTANFCIWILYPATLPNSCIRFFLGVFKVFCVCHLQIMTALLLFFIWMPFLFFFLFVLIALARTSSSMLNKSGKSGHPSIIADLRGNASAFHH